MGMGIEVMGKHGNGNAVLEWEWMGIGMGKIRWEWEGNGNKKVIPAHLYISVSYKGLVRRLANGVERRVDTRGRTESANHGEEVVRRPGHDESQQDRAEHSQSFPVLPLLVGLRILMAGLSTIWQH